MPVKDHRSLRIRRKSAHRRAMRSARRSTCRGKGPAVCRAATGCKVASGKKRIFCRKTKNTRRRRGGTRKGGRRVGGSRRR